MPHRPETHTGEVVRVVHAKGHGFVRHNGIDYRFIKRAVGGGVTFEELCRGQRVTFRETDAIGEPRAHRIRPASR